MSRNEPTKKPPEKHKKTRRNVIQRTTSETIRLGACEKTMSNQHKQPSSSFQVTGVSIVEKDGEDSADDLDESRTEDISRVTDSASEDTCSKEADGRQVPSTTNARILGERFKVVKVESRVPFYRGRWTCIDYLDHSIHTPKDAYVYCQQQYVKPTETSIYTQAKQPITANITFRGKPVHHPTTYPTQVQQLPFQYHAGNPLHICNVSLQQHPTQVPPQLHNSAPHTIYASFGESDFSNWHGSTTIEIIHQPVSDSSLKCQDSTQGQEVTFQITTTESGGSTTSSTAAIDNKIEQAMDLVKNHLMFTVREEVEVLKLRISELLERISQLESENSYLRANASPEVLQVLNSGLYVQPGSSSQSSNCSPGKLSPR